jgi:hypothetical protein
MHVSRRIFGAVAAGALLSSLLITASPVMAGGNNVANLSGTVNCNGSTATYQAERYLTGWSTTDLYLASAAWSENGGSPITSMTLGIKIKKTGVIMDQWVHGAGRWLTFNTRNYLPNTAFFMRASMHSSVGACHNTWTGTLFY